MALALQILDDGAAPARCRECVSRREGLCAEIEARDLVKIHPFLIRRRVSAGDEFMHQGRENSHYYQVLDGTVKLTSRLRDGTEQIVGLRFPGDFLGQRFAPEMAFTAQATTDVELCKIPKSTLDMLADANRRVGHEMHRQVAAELEQTRQWLMTIAQRGARERVAGLLFDIARRQTPCGGVMRFELPLSRGDIANYLGLTVETVSRQLTAMKNAGIVTMARKTQITVPSMGALAAAAAISG